MNGTANRGYYFYCDSFQIQLNPFALSIEP